jgi:hypothetical protein
MRARVNAVGDLTADIWEHRVSLMPLFEKLGVKPVMEAKKRTRAWDGRDWRAEYRDKQRGASDAAAVPPASDRRGGAPA